MATSNVTQSWTVLHGTSVYFYFISNTSLNCVLLIFLALDYSTEIHWTFFHCITLAYKSTPLLVGGMNAFRFLLAWTDNRLLFLVHSLGDGGSIVNIHPTPVLCTAQNPVGKDDIWAGSGARAGVGEEMRSRVGA